MKICLIHTMYYPYKEGGAEIVVQQIAEGLAARGHEVVVISAGKRDEVRFHNGVKIFELRIANLYWPFGHFAGKDFFKPFWHLLDSYNPFMGRKVELLLEDERPDVVQFHNLAGLSVSAWFAAKKLGLAVIQVLHDYYNLCVRSSMFSGGRNCDGQCIICRIYRTPSRYLSGLVDVVVGVSRYVLEAHISKGLFPNARQVIIHNGYTLNKAVVVPGKLGEIVRFGYIGRLHPTKGLNSLLDAFLALKASDAELLIAGEGESTYVAYLKEHVQGKRVRFLGYTSHDNFYMAIDVVVVPSVWHDPFPGVCKEALAWGKPVIASCRGGIPEIVVDGMTGFLFDPDKPGELREAMQRFLERRHEYAIMSKACLERAKDFSEEKMIDAHEALLIEYAKKKG